MKRVAPISRRRFLRGAGGVSMGLPFLPSLDTRAFGADAQVPRNPHMFWLCTDHGGVYEESMFPSQDLLNQTADMYSDHTVRWGQLQATGSGANRGVSSVLQAAKLSDTLLGKMNVLHGIDVPWYIAHNTGQHLGNFARNDGNGDDGKMFQNSHRPTIDQIMAWSPSFYPDLSGLRERSMVLSSDRFSYGYTNPQSQSGGVQPMVAQTRSKPIFDRIFVPDSGGGPEPAPARAPIADRVLESYRRLHDGNRRLGREDKARLSSHIEWLSELERQVNQVQAGPLQSCGDIDEATEDNNQLNGNNPAEYAKRAQLFNDVIVAAFACGSSRVGVMGLRSNQRAIGYSGNWHQDVAHGWKNPGNQTRLVDAYQFIFENVFVDLADKLNSFEIAPGRTILDDTLMAWTQECGQETHWSLSVPVVTFGSAAGCLNTGRYIDYSNSNNSRSVSLRDGFRQTMGVTYNRWLGTALQAMRVPPSEYERWGHKGYGIEYMNDRGSDPEFRAHYVNTQSRYFRDGSVPLPGLWAG